MSVNLLVPAKVTSLFCSIYVANFKWHLLNNPFLLKGFFNNSFSEFWSLIIFSLIVLLLEEPSFFSSEDELSCKFNSQSFLSNSVSDCCEFNWFELLWDEELSSIRPKELSFSIFSALSFSSFFSLSFSFSSSFSSSFPFSFSLLKFEKLILVLKDFLVTISFLGWRLLKLFFFWVVFFW